MMKTILILFLAIGFSGSAQVAYNTSAESAQFFSENASYVDLHIANQFGCSDPARFSLFFYYRAESSHVSMPDPVLFTADAGTVDCAINVWGPYSSKTVADAEYGSDTTLVDYAQTSSTITVAHDMIAGKVYLMEVIIYDCSADFTMATEQPSWFSNFWEEEACIGCITGFRPQAGTYIVSGWVKEASADLGTVTYSKPVILVTSGATTTTCAVSGEIIDGWQRIEKEVVIEADDDTQIRLSCAGKSGSCYFDDIRFFPKDASMVTYVYDPITLRLMAELDERNYAKIYEYDEQGKLIRVKKETEMGIMTIQENRENNSKE